MRTVVSKARFAAGWLSYGVFVLLVTFLGVELGVRILLAGEVQLAPLEKAFWRPDRELGWDLIADFDGFFDKGFTKSQVTTDKDGIRRNGTKTTFKQGWPTILFIGDSATASLEVDNQHTVPALLEQELRSKGLHYNVVNLGVRGFGTDQSVLKAIRFRDKFRPVRIVYLYDNNDDFDNNSLRPPFRVYGKGAYVKERATDTFEPHYFGRVYENDEAAVVLLDDNCHPRIHEFRLSSKGVQSAKLVNVRLTLTWIAGESPAGGKE